MLEFRLTFHWSLFLRGLINNIPALVQIMDWRRRGDKPLSGPMMVRLPTHICVTLPQWVQGNINSIEFLISYNQHNQIIIWLCWLYEMGISILFLFSLFSEGIVSDIWFNWFCDDQDNLVKWADLREQKFVQLCPVINMYSYSLNRKLRMQ